MRRATRRLFGGIRHLHSWRLKHKPFVTPVGGWHLEDPKPMKEQRSKLATRMREIRGKGRWPHKSKAMLREHLKAKKL